MMPQVPQFHEDTGLFSNILLDICPLFYSRTSWTVAFGRQWAAQLYWHFHQNKAKEVLIRCCGILALSSKSRGQQLSQHLTTNIDMSAHQTPRKISDKYKSSKICTIWSQLSIFSVYSLPLAESCCQRTQASLGKPGQDWWGQTANQYTSLASLRAAQSMLGTLQRWRQNAAFPGAEDRSYGDGTTESLRWKKCVRGIQTVTSGEVKWKKNSEIQKQRENRRVERHKHYVGGYIHKNR